MSTSTSINLVKDVSFISEVEAVITKHGWKRFKYAVWVILRQRATSALTDDGRTKRLYDIAERIHNLPNNGVIDAQQR
jgi:hypothetical protein